MNWLERHLNPVTVKRLRRFKRMKRAYWAFWILVGLYVISLGSNLICNDVPILMRYRGQWYFPVLKFYPDDVFTGSGLNTRPDYKAIAASHAFSENPADLMIFPPVPNGPYEIIEPATLPVRDEVTVELAPEPMIGSVNVDRDWKIVRSVASRDFFGKDHERLVRGLVFVDYWEIPPEIQNAVRERFGNRTAEAVHVEARGIGATEPVVMTLAAFRPRRRPPRSVRITLRGQEPHDLPSRKIVFARNLDIVSDAAGVWSELEAAVRETLLDGVQDRFTEVVEPRTVQVGETPYRVQFGKEEVRFPFPPTRGHWLGIDAAGRDVLARVLYGLRTSLTFGLILVLCAIALGIVIGSVQGYLGGAVDIIGQRLIEIWSALPFLYIMILMGSVYGRSFGLLIFCYGLFNWIGMSYYMRAEFLRLRKQTFVEAAKCMGLPAPKIIFRHILPNGLVPVITLFPFSLVGAVGALAALDYLGFGLPPPTPSWGELLQQAQQFRWAWWLILYPSLALFTVMLLGVFIGEGVRNAYDPRQFSRIA